MDGKRDRRRALDRWENEGGRAVVALWDVVCGAAVTEESRHRHEHDGRTYYFCSETCRAKFVALRASQSAIGRR